MEEIKSKYIYFGEVPTNEAKTRVWDCYSLKSDYHLGIIKWNPTWRQYCYFPTETSYYNPTCLVEISNFVKGVMDEYREEKKHKRELTNPNA